MLWNGVLVTSATRSQDILAGANYRGIAYGIPWPLGKPGFECDAYVEDNLIDAVNNQVSGQVFSDETFPVAVLSDINLARRYVMRCREQAIAVRTLLCATPRSYPSLDTFHIDLLLSSSTPFGYDYAYSSCEFSAVYSDFNPIPSSEFEQLASLLNIYGLFDSLTDLESYIATRWSYIHESGPREVLMDGVRVRISPLEDSGDFVMFQLREVMWPLRDLE